MPGMKKTLFLMVLCCAVFSQYEVLEISNEFTPTLYSEIALSGGRCVIGDSAIYLAGEGAVFIQQKGRPDENVWLNLDLKHNKYYSIASLLYDNNKLRLFFRGLDGMYYLCTVDMDGTIVRGPVRKHGKRGHLKKTNDDLLLHAGLYRPLYATYLDLYDDESGPGPTDQSKRMFRELYRSSDAFFLWFYDDSLQRVDSAAVLPLKGEEAEAYERLYFSTPMDIDASGNVYFIDHIDGYTVKRLDPGTQKIDQFSLWNKNYNPIPIRMNKDESRALDSKSGSYSRAYALHSDDTHILTSFVQNNASRDPNKGPYHIDVMTVSGKQLLTMTSDYPVVSEDSMGRVFFAVLREGGWFKASELFLVGMTIQDVLNGAAEQKKVDEAINHFKKQHRK